MQNEIACLQADYKCLQDQFNDYIKGGQNAPSSETLSDI